MKKVAKVLKEAETTEEKKAGLAKLKAAQEKRIEAEHDAEAQHFAGQAEKEAKEAKGGKKPAEDAAADPAMAKLQPDEIARVKQAEAEGKASSTKAQIAFEKAMKTD